MSNGNPPHISSCFPHIYCQYQSASSYYISDMFCFPLLAQTFIIQGKMHTVCIFWGLSSSVCSYLNMSVVIQLITNNKYHKSRPCTFPFKNTHSCAVERLKFNTLTQSTYCQAATDTTSVTATLVLVNPIQYKKANSIKY